MANTIQIQIQTSGGAEAVQLFKQLQAATVAFGDGSGRAAGDVERLAQAAPRLDGVRATLQAVPQELADAAHTSAREVSGLLAEIEHLADAAEVDFSNLELLDPAEILAAASALDTLSARIDETGAAADREPLQRVAPEEAQRAIQAGTAAVEQLRGAVVELEQKAQSSGGLAKIRGELEQLEGRLQKVGTGLRQFGADWSMGVSAPVGAALGGSLKFAVDFEKSMAMVAKTTNATEAEIASMAERFTELSERIPVSRSELASIAATAGQLGVQIPAIAQFSEVMAGLAVAAEGLSASDGAMSLAKFASITQMPQTQFDRLAATIVELGNNYETLEGKIIDLGLRIAGAGAIAGLTEAQMMGVAAGFASITEEVEASGTAIQKVLLGMNTAVVTGGKRLDAFARAAGMSAQEFADVWRANPAEAFVQFVEGLQGAGDRAELVLRELGLSDQRLIRAFIGMAGAGDKLRESVESGSRAWEENKALTDETSRLYETTWGELKTLGNQAANVAGDFGTALLPALRDGVDAAKALIGPVRVVVQMFTEAPSAMKTTVLAVGALVTVTGPAAVGLGQLVLVLRSVSTAARAATAATTALQGAQALAGVTAGAGAAAGAVAGTTSAMALLGTTLAIGGPVILGLGWLAAGYAKVRIEAMDAARASRESVAQFKADLADMDAAHLKTASDSASRVFLSVDQRLAAAKQALQDFDKPGVNLQQSDRAQRRRELQAELDIVQAEWVAAREKYTAAADALERAQRAAAELSKGLGGTGGFDFGGTTEIDQLTERAGHLITIYDELRARGESYGGVLQQIRTLQGDVEAIIRSQGDATDETRAKALALAGDLRRALSGAGPVPRGSFAQIPLDDETVKRLVQGETQARDRLRDLQIELAQTTAALAQLRPGTEAFQAMESRARQAAAGIAAARIELEIMGGRASDALSQYIPAPQPTITMPRAMVITELQFAPSAVAEARVWLERALELNLSVKDIESTWGKAAGERFRAQIAAAGITSHDWQQISSLRGTDMKEADLKRVLGLEGYEQLQGKLGKLGISIADLAKMGERGTKDLEKAGTVAVGTFGALAQALIQGSDDIMQIAVGGLTNIASSLAGGGVQGAVIGAIGGILGSLMGRDSRRTQPVRIEEYGSRAVQQMKREGPDNVILQIVSATTGEVLDTVQYDLGRRERRDKVARFPKNFVPVGG